MSSNASLPTGFKTRRCHSAARSRGLSLIVVILILVVVSVLGLGAAQIALMGAKSTRFDRDRAIAWEAADAALVDAQYDIMTGSRASMFKEGSLIGFAGNCGASGDGRGLCAPNTSGKPLAYTVDFSDASGSAHSVAIGQFTGRPFQAGLTGIRPAQKPRYIIEALPDIHQQSSLKAPGSTAFIYRITAMGFGPTNDTQVVLQMVFRKGA